MLCPRPDPIQCVLTNLTEHTSIARLLPTRLATQSIPAPAHARRLLPLTTLVACLCGFRGRSVHKLFDAHTKSFAALGGVARRGIYDNMKTAVDKDKKGKGRLVNARFAVRCAHYLFDADFCNVASGWEKGVVEKNVQDSRTRIWLDAQSRK